MQFSGQVLRYTSSEFKYQQMIVVSEDEKCNISQFTIKELYEEHVKRGVPHVLALVHGDQGGQDIYDAATLSDFLVRGKRWEWTNPATNEKIKRIDFFALNTIGDGYQLLRKVKVKSDNGQCYEDLWFCHNLSLATECDNPHVFNSIVAVVRHYMKTKNAEQEARWRYICYQSIEQHYGKGMALLFLPIILSGEMPFLDVFLFTHLKYTVFDELLVGGKLEELISSLKENLFDREKRDVSYSKAMELLNQDIQDKIDRPGAMLARCLINSSDGDSLSMSSLETFVTDTHPQVSHLAQAILCCLRRSYVGQYADQLVKSYPQWRLGQALLMDFHMEGLERDALSEKLDALIDLSRDTKDPCILQLLALRFDQFGVTSQVWKSTENVCMKMLSITRFQERASRLYVKAIKKDGELQNALLILKNNVAFLNNFNSLGDLADMQRDLGVTKTDREHYFEGVRNGLRVFENRSRHNRLVYSLGQDLVAEITPFKATKELEAKGVEILRDEMKSAPNNTMVPMILGEYLIRKGSEREAKEAQGWIETLKKRFYQDLTLHMASVRAQLRFASSKEDLLKAEEMIAECEKLGSSPTLFLLKALLQSHYLRRDAQPEWFILAAANFKTAFENADKSHVQFLLDHLSRYDKLTEDDQVKCRKIILELLGFY